MYRSPFKGSDLSHDPQERFLDQFEWDGGDWLYRYKETGQAYRVSDAEKDAFVAAFDRWQKWSGWTAVLVLLGLFVVLWRIKALPPLSAGSSGVGFIVGAGIRCLLNIVGFRAPLRALDQRAPAAPALSNAARAQLALDRASPTELVGTSFAAAGFLFLSFLLWPVDGLAWLPIAGFGWMTWRAVTHWVRECQARTVAPVTSPAT